jgi:hypothetical protein
MTKDELTRRVEGAQRGRGWVTHHRAVELNALIVHHTSQPMRRGERARNEIPRDNETGQGPEGDAVEAA